MDLLIRVLLMIGSGALVAVGPLWGALSALLLFVVASGNGVRMNAVLVACFYSVALLPAGVAAMDYTGSVLWAVLSWSVPLGINTLVMTLGLSAPERWRPLSVIGAVVVLSVPPLAMLSLVSPLVLAGLIFPGTASVGLILMLALMGALSVLNERTKRLKRVQLIGVTVLSLACHSVAIATPLRHQSADQIGQSTYRGMPNDRKREAFRIAYRYEELERSESLHEHTIIWPESTYGNWHSSDGELLSQSSKTLIGGARVWVSHDRYVNVLVKGDSGEIVYAQEVPVPVAFGKPTRAVSATQLTDEIENRVDALLCFEVVSPWAAAHAFAKAETRVIWAANLGWSQTPQLAKRLIQHVHCWSALYRKPVSIAVNYAEKFA